MSRVRKDTLKLYPGEHPTKQLYIDPEAEEPITMQPYDPTKGIVEIRWEETLRDQEGHEITKPFKLHLDPDTFARLNTDRYGRPLNPYTRQPIQPDQITRISPPRALTWAAKDIQRHTRPYLAKKKERYTAAAKVIQRHARAYLAKKEANQDPTTLMKNYSIRYKRPQYRVDMVGLTYKGKLFRLDFGADWTPKRAPKVITLKGFDWEHYRELPSDAAEDQMLSHFLCRKLKKYEPRVAPGDIIDMDFQYRLNYFYYITHKGTIKELPSDDMSHPTYIPKDAMRAFYDHRNDSPELALIYKKAIQYYWRFLRDMGGNYGNEYVVHQYREGDDTLQYYTIDRATQEPVIKTSSPLHDSAYKVPSSIRTPSPLGVVQGGASCKKKSNT